MSGDVRGRAADIFEDVPRCPCDVRRLVLILPAMPTATTQVQLDARPAAARVGLTRDEVMTAVEVADLLHLPVSTVYYLARRGELPARRLGRTWRFLRPRLV